LLALFDRDQARIQRLVKRASSALRVFAEFQRSPILSVPHAAQAIGISQPTIQKALGRLAELGIIREITGRRRNRLYQYDAYLEILSEGTEPLAR
jgi:Fic family protein